MGTFKLQALQLERANRVSTQADATRKILRQIPASEFKTIDINTKIAREMCLVYLSLFNTSIFKYDDEPNYWHTISRRTLKTRIGDNYYEVRRLLTNNNIIRVKENEFGDEIYTIGFQSKQYQLTEDYRRVKLTHTKLTTHKLINNATNEIARKLKEIEGNILVKNMYTFYNEMTYMSTKEMTEYGKQLTKNNYHSKKGVKLTFLGKKTKTYYVNSPIKRGFIEDHITSFELYYNDGALTTPKIGSTEAGRRVYDAFNMSASWIRKTLKYKGYELAEIDFSCLHPNIAMALYGGESKYITHKGVAEATGISVLEVKIEHLSFFNKKVCDMKKSPLWNYYMTNEPKMMKNLITDKNNNKHKITSQRMFFKETQIMENITQRLMDMDIATMYVFDALYVAHPWAKVVAEVMEEEILKLNIYTTTSTDMPEGETLENTSITLKDYTTEVDIPQDLITDVLSNDNLKDNTTPVKEEIVAETPSKTPTTYNDDEWTPIEGSNDGLFGDLIKKNEEELNNLLKYEIKEEKIESPIEIKQPTEEYSMFGDLLKPNEW